MGEAMPNWLEKARVGCLDECDPKTGESLFPHQAYPVVCDFEPEHQRTATKMAEVDTKHREVLVQVFNDLGMATGHGDTHVDLLKELVWQVKEVQAALRQRGTADAD